MKERKKGTKDRADERVVTGRQASPLCVAELMTGIKEPGWSGGLLGSPGSARLQPGPPIIPGDLRESDSIWPKIS